MRNRQSPSGATPATRPSIIFTSVASLLLSAVLLCPAIASAAIRFSTPLPLNSDAASDSSPNQDDYAEVATDGSGNWISMWSSRYDQDPDWFDVMVRRSTDAGTTWLASDVRLDTDGIGAADSYAPVLCCDGANVFAAWYDFRAGGAADVYCNRSVDGGTTWLASDVRLDTDVAGAAASTNLQVACCQSDVYVAWLDSRNGADDVYVLVNHVGRCR